MLKKTAIVPIKRDLTTVESSGSADVPKKVPTRVNIIKKTLEESPSESLSSKGGHADAKDASVSEKAPVREEAPVREATCEDVKKSPVREEPTGEEEEYDLHPKLQELLECFVNDDKFTMVPKGYLETMRQQLTTLQQSFDFLTKKVSSSLTSQAPAQVTSEPTSQPASQLVERRVTFEEGDIQVVRAGPAKDRLTSLLQQYGTESHAVDAEVSKSNVIDEFNKFFNGTYIFNFSGKGVKVAKYLTRLGVKNCVVIDPVLPENCPVIHKILYYINDVIELAEERGDQTINVIADIVNIHRCFFEVFSKIISSVQQDCWDVLQYSCTDSNPNTQAADFDYAFYLAANPDLSASELNTESKARTHWTTRGFRAGKLANGKLLLTNSNNTIAFALKSSSFKTLRDNIKTAMAAKKEVPFMNVNGRLTKKMVVPNLFTIPLTPKMRLALRCPAECYVSP